MSENIPYPSLQGLLKVRGSGHCEAVYAEAISMAAAEIASTGQERRSRNDTWQGFPTLRKP